MKAGVIFGSIFVVTLLIASGFGINTVKADRALDQQQTSWNNEAIVANGPDSYCFLAQSFKPTKNILTNVEVFIRSYNTPTQPITLSIRSDLSGANLASLSKPASAIPSSSQWINFDFTDISVTPESTYYIVLETSLESSSAKGYMWAIQNPGDLYTRGCFWRKNTYYDWHQWLTGADATFKTYGYDSAPPPGNPSSLNAQNPTADSIYLSWTMGSGSDTTVIRRKTTGYPTTYNDGDLAYSGSGTSTTNTGLSSGQIYYYRAWAYNTGTGQYSTGYSSDSEYTKPGGPSNLAVTGYTQTTISLSWVKGTGGDKTMIRHSTGSYPSSPYSGTQVYFDTGTSCTDTGLTAGTTYYYRAWAYDSDSTYYSDEYTQTTGTTNGSNTPPDIPAAPQGQTTGYIDISYPYVASTIDPDGDNVFYKFDWGDGTYSDWLGPYGTGTPCTEPNSWSSAGTFNVKVKAKDEHGVESPSWSSSLVVHIYNPTGSRYAVIVGCEDYIIVNDIFLTIDDALDVNNVLTDNGWNNIELLTDATAGEIQTAINTMEDNEGENSICLFFFSGHGHQIADDNGDEADSLDEVLCGVDYNPNIPTGYIRDDWLKNKLDEFQGTVVVILEACNSGGMNHKNELVGNFSGMGVELAGDNREILCSCREDESSSEIPALQNSLFPYYIIDGWDGDADANSDNIITSEETFDYANTNANSYQTNNYGYIWQHAVMYDVYDGDIPIIISAHGITNPPNIPSNPIPSDGQVDVNLTTELSVQVADPDENIMYVVFYWENNTELGVDTNIHSNSRAQITVSGLSPDTVYRWYVNVSDGFNIVTSPVWEFTTGNTSGENQPPNKPDRPSGTQFGFGRTFSYTTSSTDPDGDQVYFMWDWGDGTLSEWIGPYNSSDTISYTHTWNFTKIGMFSIKVKAKDGFGAVSPWSDPLSIIIFPKTAPPVISVLQWLFERFPHAFPILRHLLGY